MNREWFDFLRAQEALQDKSTLSEAQFDATEDGNACIEVSHLGVIEISGKDAKKLLQGQVTCDIDAISSNQAGMGAICNNKGRAYASFIIVYTGNAFLVILDASLLETMITVLKKYSVFFNVHLENVSQKWLLFGISGPDACTYASSIIKQQDAQLSNTHGLSESFDSGLLATGGLVVNVGFAQPRFLIVAEWPNISHLWAQFASFSYQTAVKITNHKHWRWLDTADGLCFLDKITSETFIPIELNYQHTNGISFTKGCYTGQEIIARLHYRGKAKQRLYKGRILTTNINQDTGSHPIDLIDSNDKKVGRIISMACSPSNECHFLAIIRHDAVSEQAQLNLKTEAIENLTLAQQTDSKIVIDPLPYAINNE